jgi:hypothetical protein
MSDDSNRASGNGKSSTRRPRNPSPFIFLIVREGGGGGAVTEAGVGEGHGLAGPAYRPDNALNSLCRPITTICVELNGTEMLLSGCVEV